MKKLKGLNLEQWLIKTEKMNFQKELKRGDKVIDRFGDKGIVVKIEKPEDLTIEDHGTIYVWQSEQVNYGGDNCQHYSFLGWEKMLRILD